MIRSYQSIGSHHRQSSCGSETPRNVLSELSWFIAGLERAKSKGKTLGRKKVVNDTMTAKIIELRNAKKSIRAIASEVGVSRGTVSNVLKVA